MKTPSFVVQPGQVIAIVGAKSACLITFASRLSCIFLDAKVKAVLKAYDELKAAKDQQRLDEISADLEAGRSSPTHSEACCFLRR